jgi:hypothetical protein
MKTIYANRIRPYFCIGLVNFISLLGFLLAFSLVFLTYNYGRMAGADGYVNASQKTLVMMLVALVNGLLFFFVGRLIGRNLKIRSESIANSINIIWYQFIAMVTMWIPLLGLLVLACFRGQALEFFSLYALSLGVYSLVGALVFSLLTFWLILFSIKFHKKSSLKDRVEIKQVIIFFLPATIAFTLATIQLKSFDLPIISGALLAAVASRVAVHLAIMKTRQAKAKREEEQYDQAIVNLFSHFME